MSKDKKKLNQMLGMMEDGTIIDDIMYVEDEDETSNEESKESENKQ